MARVLIGYSACPLTRAAFEAQGHEVYTCDILPARDGALFHLKMDVWEAVEMGGWDFAVLHPMCTYLTCSAAWAFKDPDYDKHPGAGYHQRVQVGTLTGEARREARREAVENFRRLLDLPFPVAVENPASPTFLSTMLRPPDQIVHPHQFGDDAAKGTGLWLTGGVPILAPTQHVSPRLIGGKCGTLPRWSNQTDAGHNKLAPSATRWLERSKTYPGIAAAMGDQWGKWLNERSAD